MDVRRYGDLSRTAAQTLLRTRCLKNRQVLTDAEWQAMSALWQVQRHFDLGRRRQQQSVFARSEQGRWASSQGQLRITDWVHVTRPAAATGAGTRTGSLGKAPDTPPLSCRSSSRGVMNRRTLSDRPVNLARPAVALVHTHPCASDVRL